MLLLLILTCINILCSISPLLAGRDDDDGDEDDDDDKDDDDDEYDGDMFEHFGQYLSPIGWGGHLSPRS